MRIPTDAANLQTKRLRHRQPGPISGKDTRLQALGHSQTQSIAQTQTRSASHQAHQPRPHAVLSLDVYDRIGQLRQ